MTRYLGAALVMFVAAAAPAQADDMVLASRDGRHEIALQLGAFRPTARFGINGLTGDRGERFGATGFLFLADYFQALTPALSAGLEGLFINRGTYMLENLAVNPGSKTLVRGDTKAVLAMLRLRRPGTGFRPYVVGGLGAHTTTMDVFVRVRPGFIWGGGFGEEISAVKGNASGFIWVLRGGLEHAFAEGGTIGLEAGWVGIPSRRYPLTPAGRDVVGLSNDVVSAGDGLSLAVKFGYRFGGGY
ncbi:MAG: hypothetical protein NUW21_01765 [Elusimicrobia bacterium]|nr:hypothetical protein [Elusimicrobiota bacterium]